MAFQLKFRKNRPIHIIVKDYVIRCLELRQTNPLTVGQFHERYIPSGIVKDGKVIDEETFSLILEECVSEWKIAKRRVLFHVPDSFVVIRKITVPATLQDDEIYGHLYMEIGSTIHLPFEEPVFDYTVVSTSTDSKQLILFAAPEDSVVSLAYLLEEAKLTAVAADISSLSLFRLYNKLIDSQAAEQLMIVQADLHAVNVCIFEKQYPVFMRHIIFDTDHEKWSFSSQMGPDVNISYTGDKEDVQFALEDMYTELSRVIDFYRYTLNQGNKQVTKLFLTGDHPWLNLIESQIKDRIAIPIETVPKDAIKITGDSPLPPSFHSAVGLGLKGV